MHQSTEFESSIEFRELLLPETHGPLGCRMHRPILAEVGIPAGAEFRPFLPNDDASSVDDLSAKELHTTPLALTIADIRG